MKVLHLNTHREGGSYAYASLLSKALLELGEESNVVTRDPDQRPLIDGIARRATLCFARGAWHGTRRMLPPPAAEWMQDVDVVHLHTVADWFDVLRWLETLPSHVGIVVGLHDLWHISGGCFVQSACRGYLNGCGNCPLLTFPMARLLAADEIRRKRRIYRQRKAIFLTNSRWLKEIAEASAVVAGGRVEVLTPPVDTGTFKPLDRSSCRASFALESDDLVVATGCASLTDSNKNTAGLLDILASLNEPRLRVLVFGEGKIPIPDGLRLNWLGPVASKDALARIYSAADVFASASGMETYGLTLAEAQACGTPVVAYRVGGIPEAVPEGPTAVLCAPFNRGEFAAAVRTMLDNRYRAVKDSAQRARETAERSGPRQAASEALRIYQLAGGAE